MSLFSQFYMTFAPHRLLAFQVLRAGLSFPDLLIGGTRRPCPAVSPANPPKPLRLILRNAFSSLFFAVLTYASRLDATIGPVPLEAARHSAICLSYSVAFIAPVASFVQKHFHSFLIQ